MCGIYKFIVLLFEEGEKLLDLLLLGKIWYFFGYKEIIINKIYLFVMIFFLLYYYMLYFSKNFFFSFLFFKLDLDIVCLFVLEFLFCYLLNFII